VLKHKEELVWYIKCYLIDFQTLLRHALWKIKHCHCVIPALESNTCDDNYIFKTAS